MAKKKMEFDEEKLSMITPQSIEDLKVDSKEIDGEEKFAPVAVLKGDEDVLVADYEFDDQDEAKTAGEDIIIQLFQAMQPQQQPAMVQDPMAIEPGAVQ